jgi:hypothetical protein
MGSSSVNFIHAVSLLIEDVVEEKQLILFVHQQAHTWVYLMTPT